MDFSVIAWPCMAANCSWVCIDVPADSSSRMNIELYRSMLCAHARPYVAKLRGESFTVQMINELLKWLQTVLQQQPLKKAEKPLVKKMHIQKK